MALLTNLCDVGVNLAALIYDLPEDTGFDKFHSKCKSVLYVLKQNLYLTNSLVSSMMFLPLIKMYFLIIASVCKCLYVCVSVSVSVCVPAPKAMDN